MKSLGEFDSEQREGMGQEERAQKKPWFAVFGDGSTTEMAELQKENMVIWENLLSRELDESMALESMQQLIRQYYGD